MESSGTLIYGLSCLGSLLCCGFCFFLFVLILGFMLLRKKGKKEISVKDALDAGADASRAFIRGGKSREQLLAEEEEEERRGR